MPESHTSFDSDRDDDESREPMFQLHIGFGGRGADGNIDLFLHRPAVVMAAFVAAASIACCADQPNVILNGGFESPSRENPDLPLGWTPHVHGKVSVAWPAAGARSGARCLQMCADPTEKWGHAYWTSDSIPVKPCMAYRVRFHFKAKGFGVPCFSLRKIKAWRLFKGDTEGKWIAHEDVVVAPPDVTATAFYVNNYHRPGKTMWFDDVSLVELPLCESPLTQRLTTARRSVGALQRNLARLRLTRGQEDELGALRKALTQAVAAYERLEAGAAAPDDLKEMNAALDEIEQGVGKRIFTLWAVAPEDWLRGLCEPGELRRELDVALTMPADARVSRVFGIRGLIHEGAPVRVALWRDRRAREWDVQLSVTSAHRTSEGHVAWGEPSSLGELFLPAGKARFVRVQLQAGDARPGRYTFRVKVEGVDRTAEPGTITLRADVGKVGAR